MSNRSQQVMPAKLFEDMLYDHKYPKTDCHVEKTKKILPAVESVLRKHCCELAL